MARNLVSFSIRKFGQWHIVADIKVPIAQKTVQWLNVLEFYLFFTRVSHVYFDSSAIYERYQQLAQL